MSGRGKGGMGLGAMYSATDYDSEDDHSEGSYFSDQEGDGSFSEDEEETIGSSRKKRSFEETKIQDVKVENKKSKNLEVEDEGAPSGRKNDPVDITGEVEVEANVEVEAEVEDPGNPTGYSCEICRKDMGSKEMKARMECGHFFHLKCLTSRPRLICPVDNHRDVGYLCSRSIREMIDFYN